MASIIVSLFTLCVAVQAAYGLVCYECNSKDSLACSYGLTSFTYNSRECGGIDLGLIAPTCYKLEAKNKEGKEYIARGCLPPGVSGACQAIASSIGWASRTSSSESDSLEDLKCSTCESDKCNSAQKLTGATLAGLLLAAIAFLF